MASPFTVALCRLMCLLTQRHLKMMECDFSWWCDWGSSRTKNEDAHACLPSHQLSRSPCSPLLSCSYGDRVEHFRVLEGGGQYCIWEESFCSLNQLVDFYRTHSIAVEKVVCLKDPPSSPQLLSHLARNPYPNPYKSTSQESIPSGRLYSNPSHPEGNTSSRLLKPVVEVWHTTSTRLFLINDSCFC